MQEVCEKMIAKWEEDLLPLSLITTKEAAQAIIRRNENLLRAAKINTYHYVGYIGCSHCIAAMHEAYRKMKPNRCSFCDWKFTNLLCLDTSFNGVTAKMAATHSIKGGVVVDRQGVFYQTNSEEYYPCASTALKEKAIIVIEAHILWGERIADGTYENECAKK